MNPFLQPDEPVQEPPTPAPDDGTPDVWRDADKRLFEGVCQGGPLDGRECVSRFELGFLLCDRRGNKCWIYDWVGDGFKVRQEEPMELVSDKAAPKNRFSAAEENKYDVIAAPWGGEEDVNPSA